MVRVGDKVEVRDSKGVWSEGTVESIGTKSGLPQVIKDGWDVPYEWDECRVIE